MNTTAPPGKGIGDLPIVGPWDDGLERECASGFELLEVGIHRGEPDSTERLGDYRVHYTLLGELILSFVSPDGRSGERHVCYCGDR